jgi:putative ABC transport system substrate-binding protein
MQDMKAILNRTARSARPGTLDLYERAKREPVINLRTPKGLGLTIPQSILVRADEVIR